MELLPADEDESQSQSQSQSRQFYTAPRHSNHHNNHHSNTFNFTTHTNGLQQRSVNRYYTRRRPNANFHPNGAASRSPIRNKNRSMSPVSSPHSQVNHRHSTAAAAAGVGSNSINANDSQQLQGTSNADVAAGFHIPNVINHNLNNNSNGVSKTSSSTAGEMEQFWNQKLESYHSSPLLLFGIDLSKRFSRSVQFCICAGGVFSFTLLYGYLQELLAVQLFSRDLALFLASVQFFGYTFWACILQTFVYGKPPTSFRSGPSSMSSSFGSKKKGMLLTRHGTTAVVPLSAYIRISLVRAIDLGMTNSSMKYINYPAKTLVKSSRVIFTMLVGVIVTKKSYPLREYLTVLTMILGLIVFLHADASQAAIFQPIGVVMLVTSLTCDGFITNWSEIIMRQYDVEQDEFIFRLYSIAFVAIFAAAYAQDEISRGFTFLTVPGTVEEIANGHDPTWSVSGKCFVMVLFSTSGFFGSSAAAAITKHFGALPMSITSTARKATTLFLSFALFGNDCSMEHIAGVFIFIGALLMKAFSKSTGGSPRKRQSYERNYMSMTPSLSLVNMELTSENAEGKEIV